MASIADPELTRAFQELQIEVVNTREKVHQMMSEISICERRLLIRQLTKKTVEKLDPKDKCFVGLGRAFVKKDQKEVLTLLDDYMEKDNEKITTMKQTKEYQENKVKEMENNIREMIQQRKKAAEKK